MKNTSDNFSNKELPRLVQQIKSELKQKESEADKFRSTFLANVSHEIRTPMNAIVGFSNLLSDSCYTIDQKKFFVSEINKNSKELLRLIDNILRSASIESNKIDINLGYFDLQQMMENLLSKFHMFFNKEHSQDIKLELISVPLENVKIYSDEKILSHAVQNLIDNAIKYTADGIIEFGYKPVENNIEFFVKGAGTNIKDRNDKQQFTKFKQANDSDYIMEKGLEFGLTIADKYIGLLGGKLKLKSTFGNGSSFSFSLPVLLNETV